jgi:hypothetical protein
MTWPTRTTPRSTACRPVVFGGNGGSTAESVELVQKYYYFDSGACTDVSADTLKGPIVTPVRVPVPPSTGYSAKYRSKLVYASFEGVRTFSDGILHVRVTLPANYTVTMHDLFPIKAPGRLNPVNFVAGLMVEASLSPFDASNVLVSSNNGMYVNVGPRVRYDFAAYTNSDYAVTDRTTVVGISEQDVTHDAYIPVPLIGGLPAQIYGLLLYAETDSERPVNPSGEEPEYQTETAETMNATTLPGVLTVGVVT